MNEARWVVFDAEGDDLKPSLFYCLSYEAWNGEKGTLTDYGDIRKFFLEFDVYVGHNIALWDLLELERVVGISIPDRFVDTRCLAWYLDPSRKKNGLEAYGEHYGVPKLAIRDWKNGSLDEYTARCERDVQINVILWKDQLSFLNELYGQDVWPILRYLESKMRQVELQHKSRWKLDVELCKSNLRELQEERQPRYDELQRVLPEVPVTKTFTQPKVLYRKDGELTVAGARWKDTLEQNGYRLGDLESLDVVVDYEQGNPNSYDQLKSWLFSLGWKPREYKSTVNAKGETKEVPQINLPPQKGGGLCPSILELAEEEPAIDSLANWGVIKHRISILEGFLRDVSDDGYLTASINGLTNTFRFKHSILVNLPKVESRYGKYIRPCLIAPDDSHELLGSDMSGLEDKIKQHFIYPKDPEYVRDLQREDYDPHIDIAVLGGLIPRDDGQAYITYDRMSDSERARHLDLSDVFKRVKPVRSIAKNGNYACQYGAGPPRLEITCGISKEAAQNLWETYWTRNWAIKKIASEQKIKTVRGQMFLLNPISGFYYTLRYKKDIFSTLVQGSAAFCFDVLVTMILADRPELTGQFHDEFILTIKKGQREEATEWLLGIVDELNDYLDLNVKLAIGIQFGDNYGQIH